MPAEEPAPVPEVTAAAVPTPPPVAAAPPPPPADPPPNSPFAAYLNAAGVPDPAPSPAENGVPEGVPSALAGDVFPDAEELMRDALAQAHRAPRAAAADRADRDEPAGRRDPGPRA